MFLNFIARKLRFWGNRLRFQEPEQGAAPAGDAGGAGEPENGGGKKEEPPKDTITKSQSANVSLLKSMLSNSGDLKIHSFKFGPDEQFSATLLFIDGLVNSEILTQGILRPLKDWTPKKVDLEDGRDLTAELNEKAVCIGETEVVNTLSDLLAGCLAGDTSIVVDGCETGLVVSTKGWDKRSVSEPQSETVVRGPREGFTENIRTNTALIRRKIRNGKLRLENMMVGEKTRTDICLMYIEGVADPRVIREVKYRIGNLDIDSVLESGYIEEYIEDAPFSPFATVGFTEKPDVVAGRILEGRIAIVVDGTPFVLTAPMLFVESFQTAEDYYVRPLYASIIRIVRYLGYLITIYAPAVYIALTDFHQELIPTTLLFTIADAREGTPFPVLIETLIMVFAYEILREAGIRLPRPVGQAIGIVGALIMGDAAVSAGLVGAPVVIIIALMAVSGFLVPMQNDSSSILRIVMMLLASFAGWYGISMGFMALLMHLGSLSSFGVPYFDGFAWTRNLEDSIVRLPLWTMVKRPRDIAYRDVTRRKFFIPPLRPYETEELAGSVPESEESHEEA